jgi:hypothetical protein
MPQVGFEYTIPVFEREKTVHVLDRAATVIGSHDNLPGENTNVVKKNDKMPKRRLGTKRQGETPITYFK